MRLHFPKLRVRRHAQRRKPIIEVGLGADVRGIALGTEVVHQRHGQVSIRTVKRLINQRQFVGKGRDTSHRAGRKRLTSTESLVNAYRRESQKQKLMIKKARICDAKLVFITTAFEKLVRDENFMTLLRAEILSTMPKY